MSHHPHLVFLTALAIAAGTTAAAQDREANLKGLQLGQHWYGAEVNHDDLRGKVILVEYWGS